MAYAKRYVGGFVDLPSQTTAIDSTFLNAVEAALLKLFDTDPTVDGQIQSWISASTKFGPALILNKNVDAAAAIVKSKLDLTGANGIVNADVAGAAAIARSKLDFGSGLVNADIATAAAIAPSKVGIVRGVAVVAWPGGASISSAVTVTHGLGSTPTSVVATQGTVNSGITTINPIQVVNIGSTTFQLAAQTVDGSTPAAAANMNVNWIAVI